MELRKRHYEIRPEHRGWKLEIFEEGESMGGGFFPFDVGNEEESVDAWNAAYEQGEEWASY